MLRSTLRSLITLALALSFQDAASAEPIDVGTVGNEPLITVAPDRTIVISALQHLYASTDGGQTFFAVTGPPFASELNLNSDSSINFDPAGRLYFSFDWPYAGSTAVCTTDSPLGASPTWTSSPAALPGGTDRMWVIAPSTDVAYAVTNEGLYETTFLVSTDRGATWTPSGFAPGLLEPQTGPLLADPASSDIFQVAKNEGELGFYVYSPTAAGQVTGAFRGTGAPAPMALPSGAFATDGMLWTSTETPNATGGREVTVLASSDRGVSWSTLPAIPSTTAGTAIFSWLAAGARGHVGVIFYWTPESGDPGALTAATWNVVWAESFDADSPLPHWNVTTLEAGVRTGAICIAADCTGANRFAGDFISSTFDPDGVAHLAWMKDVPRGIRYARQDGRTVSVPASIPAAQWLAAPAPNPARSGVGLRFGMAREAFVSLALFDPAGRRVRELLSERMPSGAHEVRWDVRDAHGDRVPSGLYFVRLTIEGRVMHSTLVVLPS
jgi:hypothetical protein